ncbi:MAG: universal stress protein [Proteobacteria bacterium]|nr:universal stress protein [Pseudomonadota bacterium]
MLPAPLMVHVPPGDDTSSLLQFAKDVASWTNARKIIGIAALRPLQIYAGPNAYVPQGFFQQDWEVMERELALAEKQFRGAFDGMSGKIEWRSAIVPGLASDYVAEQMRAADLLITPGSPRGNVFDSARYMDVADLILKAGRPVLVAGVGVSNLDLANVMICWKDRRESRRAVEDSVPFLRMASKITVVEVAGRDELSEAEARLKDVVAWLAAHDIAATARVERGGDEDSVVLSGLVEDLKAGMVVGGAYGHSRLREWVLGGVTRDLLLRPAGCSLVSH